MLTVILDGIRKHLNEMMQQCIPESISGDVTANIRASGIDTKLNNRESAARYIEAIIRSLEPQAIATDSGTGSGVTSIKRDPPSWEHHVSVQQQASQGQGEPDPVHYGRFRGA